MPGYLPPPTFGFDTPAASTDLNTLSADIADLDARTKPYVGTDGSTRTTTSNTFISLGTASVAAPIGANGLAIVSLYSSLQGDTIGALVEISYMITGGGSYGPLDHDSVTYQVANVLYSARYGAMHVAAIGAVTPGTPRRMCTFTMMYKTSSGTASFVDSRIVVIPLGG